MTHRERIEQANTRLTAAKLELQAADQHYWDCVRDAARDGASFRDLGEVLHVAPATVLRHIGRKGEQAAPSALDFTPRRRARKRPVETGRA
jgi:transposase-like protein